MHEASEVISPLVGTEKGGEIVKMGADGTPTKLIDLVAEDKVVEILEATGRPVTLISEEIGELKIGEGASEVVFVVDPLDGTSNAVKSIPAYGISIAVADASKKSKTINSAQSGTLNLSGTESTKLKDSNVHEKNFNIKPIRGNIDTRIKKVIRGDYDATIMAEAGLNRLGLTEHIKEIFSIDYFTPAAGQGALAVVARDDTDKRDVLRKLNHSQSESEVIAEKTVLQELGVGCQWPLGVSARTDGDVLNLQSILLTKEGEVLSKVNLQGSAAKPRDLGVEVAKRMMEDYV